MDYIKIRFGNDFDWISSKIEKSFKEMYRPRPVSPMFASSECAWAPPMDVFETPEEIIILAEIAGVNHEQLEVEINSQAVKIKGRRSPSLRSPNCTYRLAEIQYGKFERTLHLPFPVDTEVVSSAYDNGLLQIRMAKRPQDERHNIPIEDG